MEVSSSVLRMKRQSIGHEGEGGAESKSSPETEAETETEAEATTTEITTAAAAAAAAALSTSNCTTMEQMDRVKREVFHSMFEEIVQVLQSIDPDKAKGIEQLMLAHDALFFSPNVDVEEAEEAAMEGESGESGESGKKVAAATYVLPTAESLERNVDQHRHHHTSCSSSSSGASDDDEAFDASDASSDDGDDDKNASASQRCQESSCVQCLTSSCRVALRSLPRPSIFQWLPKYTLKLLPADLISSVCISIFGIPQSLAYASLIGLDPGAGL